jgi:tryptophan-rich sensory protein
MVMSFTMMWICEEECMVISMVMMWMERSQHSCVGMVLMVVHTIQLLCTPPFSVMNSLFFFLLNLDSCSIGHPPHSSASPVELRLRVPPRALSG